MNHILNFEEVRLDETLFFTTDVSKVRKASEKENQFTYTGENKKHIVFAYNPENKKNIPAAVAEMLEKMVIAMQLSINDVTIINLCASISPAMKDMIQMFQPKIFLLFGAKYKEIQLHIHINPLEIICWNSIYMMECPPLEKLDSNSVVKGQYWELVKEMLSYLQ